MFLRIELVEVLLQCRSQQLTVVEPIPERLKAMLNQVFCRPEIEPGIELVDDTLESYDGEKTR